MKCNHEWVWNQGSKVYYCHLCNGTIKKIKQKPLHNKLKIMVVKG